MRHELADPADHGNQPGSGPLRPGGVGAVVPVAEHSRPDTESAAVKRQHPALEIVRDLWGGTESVRDKSTKYLPMAPAEDPQVYRARLERSVFHNFFRRTIDGLTGLVFRKDPMLSKDVPPQIVADWENIDNAGTHGDVFVRQQLTDALAAGHNAILVEYPQVSDEDKESGVASRKEVMGEIRPYWVPLLKDNIVSWRTMERDGATILTQLVVRETTMVPEGEFGESKQTRYRVFHNKDGEVGYRLLEVMKDKSVKEHEAGTYPTQVEIPVAEVVTAGRRGMFDSDPPCMDIGWLNIAHYQQWSDRADTLHKVAPFLFTAGVQLGEDDVIVAGPNTSISAPNPDAKAEYVAHSGAGISDQTAALEELKNDIGSLGLAMLAPQKRAAETVEAKRLDKVVQDSALAVTARGLQDAVERAMGFHARYRKLKQGGSVTINRDFEAIMMEAPVMSAFAMLVKVGFPPRAVLKALQQGGRISEDEDLEALEMEWMAGSVAMEREGELEEAEDELDEAA